MKTAITRLLPFRFWLLLSGLFHCAPLLANKFETIGGGVQGSAQIKVEYLQVVAFVTAGLFLLLGILAIVLRKKDAQSLNYTMWKSSAAICFLLAIGALAAAVLMH